jgi:hypothetical protein
MVVALPLGVKSNSCERCRRSYCLATCDSWEDGYDRKNLL